MVTEKFKFPKLAYISCSNDYLCLKDGLLTISEGYMWDGASGPTWDDKTNMTGSLVHDALYQILREGEFQGKKFVREYADEVLRDMCIAASKNKFLAKIRYNTWFWMVRKFAKRSSTPKQKPRGQIVEVKP